VALAASGIVSQRMIALLGVMVGVAVYAVCLFLFRAVGEEELSVIPGGRKILAVIGKLGGGKK